MRGRLSSLQALQQAALGEQDVQVADWLSHQGLSDAPRLAKQLDVDSGWETAVETVLGSNLEAVCTEGIDDIAGALAELAHHTLHDAALMNEPASVSFRVATRCAAGRAGV